MTIDPRIEKVVNEFLCEQGLCPDARDGRCTWCYTCTLRWMEPLEDMVRNGATRIGTGPAVITTRSELARLIDHTNLKPEATPADITKLCQEAKEYGFAAVCVNPCYVPLCRRLLTGTDVLVATVVGFPLGANASRVKAYEARAAVEDGADELDMVLNVGMLKGGEYDYVEEDIRAVCEAARGRTVKVILETCLLTDEEKIKACLLAKRAGAQFVKTSTGFNKAGATLADVALMRRVVGETMGVKAAGGIRDYPTAARMVEMGATRLGASASVAIVREAEKEEQKPAEKLVTGVVTDYWAE